MRKRFFSILQYIIFLGGGIFLVWWQLRSMTPVEREDFINSLLSANYWLIIPVILISVLSHISRAMRWKLLMEPLGYKPAFKNLFFALMVGYLANAAVPRLGEVLKCTFLARYEKLQVDKLFGTIVIERIFDLICFIIFISITFLIQIDVVGSYLKKKLIELNEAGSLPIWAKLLVLILFFTALVLIIKILFKRYPGNRLIFKISNFLRGIMEGIRTIKNLKHRKLFLGHTLFIWFMYVLQVYIAFTAMESTAHLGVKPAFTILTVATIAMIIIPNGMGIFPLFIAEALVIYGIAYPAGNAFGSLIWGLNTGIVIILGLASLVLLPYLNKKKHEISTVDPG